MEPSSVEIDKIAHEFDRDACEFCERYKNKGLSRSSKLLLRFILGFTVPRDEGITKLPFRLALKVVNYFQRRSGGVLFYLHPLGTIDKTLRESGFSHRRKQGSRFWLVFLYSRVG